MNLPNDLRKSIELFDSRYPKLKDKKESCFKFNGLWTIIVEHDPKKIGEAFLFAVNTGNKTIQQFSLNPIVVKQIVDEGIEFIDLQSDEYLEHHGIKGQKWGVRNGPPYPLADNAHSTSEKKATLVSDQKAGGAEVLVAELAFYSAVIAAAVVAAKVADKRRTQHFEDEYYNNREIKTLDDCPKIDPNSMSMDEHMKEINPDYPDFGAVQNCMFCTTAMAMRMKGYDVVAEKSPDGWSAKNLAKTWENLEIEQPKCKTTSDLEKHLIQQGDGAYGNLMVYWSTGGGHSVFYKVDNGEVKIYDTQSNKTRKIRDFNGVIAPKSSNVIRLDNKEPTEYALGCVKKKGGTG